MRRPSVVFYAALIGIGCAAALYPPLAHAAGDVLLPSEANSSGTSLPDLGLGRSASTPTTPAPTTPPPLSQAMPPPSGPPTSPPGTPLQSSPTPSFDIKDMVTTPVSSGNVAALAPGMIPTHIIHVPDTSAMLTQNTKLPYGLNITFSSQSVFGAADVQTLHDKLGLNASQISSSCVLSARGIVQTDKGSYMISSNTGAQPIPVRYDGMIKSYLMSAIGLCAVDPNHLPPGAGFITMVNGRLIIPLQQITCQPPTRQASAMIITYNGTASSHCSYN